MENEMMRHVRVGVIGVGNMGIRHARIYHQLDNARLVAICDLNKVALANARILLGDVFATENVDELLARDDIEAVSICMPDDSHFEIIIKAIKHHKNILVEKPLADNYRAATEIAAALNGYPQKVMVGHLLRFDPRYSGAYNLIHQGEIGELVCIKCKRASVVTGPRYYKGRSNLPFHLAVHDLDLINWYLGCKARKVTAIGMSKVLNDLGIDDCLFSNITYHNRVIVQMEHSWVMPVMYPPKLDAQMEIIGTHGVIELDLKNQGLSIFKADRSEVINTSYFFERADGILTGCLVEQIRSFLNAILTDTPVAVPVSEGLENVRLAQALLDSARENREIIL
jgi:predicted dehydrogenase